MDAKFPIWLITALLAGVVGYAVTAWVTGPLEPESSRVPPPAAFVETPASLSAADRELPPAGVVAAQMEALTLCAEDRQAIARVFAFASPANKTVTGPLAKFEQMVWRPPYQHLVVNRGWTVGKAVVRDALAAVLVTAVDRDGGLWAYRFYLSRQTGALPGNGQAEQSQVGQTTPGQWMTDAVFPVSAPAEMHESDQESASATGA